MPEWIGYLIALVLGSGAGGGITGAVLTSKRDKKSAENQLIDQLQDELSRFRTNTDARLQKLELENAAYRKYLFDQIDHMHAQGVTPLPWPDTLPR